MRINEKDTIMNNLMTSTILPAFFMMEGGLLKNAKTFQKSRAKKISECQEDGCTTKQKAGGLCNKHYQAKRRLDEMTDEEKDKALFTNASYNRIAKPSVLLAMLQKKDGGKTYSLGLNIALESERKYLTSTRGNKSITAEMKAIIEVATIMQGGIESGGSVTESAMDYAGDFIESVADICTQEGGYSNKTTRARIAPNGDMIMTFKQGEYSFPEDGEYEQKLDDMEAKKGGYAIS